MSRLRIYPDNDASCVLLHSEDAAEISRVLASIGVRFEQWPTYSHIRAGDDAQTILAAYQTQIDAVVQENGFNSIDVVSINPEHPQRDAMRAKFLEEHTHAEGEVRFFVDGSGLFSLHVDDKVYEVLCCQGDLISVPENTRHWFDMGPAPAFIAIRFFINPDGWVGHFTGSTIAQQFPRYES